MRLSVRNKFGGNCAVSGEWVAPGEGWRVFRSRAWVTVSAAVAARYAAPVVLDSSNERPEMCWYCGAGIEPLAGVLMVDHSGPRDVFAALHRDCAPFVRTRQGRSP